MTKKANILPSAIDRGNMPETAVPPMEAYQAKVERIFSEIQIKRDIILFEAIYKALSISAHTSKSYPSLIDNPLFAKLKQKSPTTYFQAIFERSDSIAKEAIRLVQQYNKRGDDVEQKSISFDNEIALQEELPKYYVQKLNELLELVTPKFSNDDFFSQWTSLIRKKPESNIRDELYKIAYIKLIFETNKALPTQESAQTYQQRYKDQLAINCDVARLKELINQINVWGFANMPGPKPEHFNQTISEDNIVRYTRAEQIEIVLLPIKLLLPEYLQRQQYKNALKLAEESLERTDGNQKDDVATPPTRLKL